MLERPDEVHVGSKATQSRFLKQQNLMEDLEQEHFKRMSFSKKELKRFK